MTQESVIADDPPSQNSIILLTGAGASAFLGLPTLATIIDRDVGASIPINDDCSQIILNVWKTVQAHEGPAATLENAISLLQTYLSTVDLLNRDRCLADLLGDVPPRIRNQQCQSLLRKAISRCFRILLDYYGPEQVTHTLNISHSQEFKVLVEYLQRLATRNGGTLQIFTTNYDCVYNVVASRSDNLSFCTHIDNATGAFNDRWYYVRRDPDNQDLQIFVHRLHGCVAWYTDADSSFRVREVFGAGGSKSLSNNPDLLTNMAIKLVAQETLGANPAFRLAFDEFHHQLETCETLLVWGHSFRDRETLRTIQTALKSQRDIPFRILFVDPYLSEEQATENIRRTLKNVLPPGTLGNVRLERVNWFPQDGLSQLTASTLECI